MRRTIAEIVVILCLLPAVAIKGQTPQRIVSTAPTITETLFALGLGKRVVGVSIYCTYPAEATKLPKVGTYLNPDPEAIARLGPDLVILQQISGELSGRLDALHISHIEAPGGTLEDVFKSIRIIGAASRSSRKRFEVD